MDFSVEHLDVGTINADCLLVFLGKQQKEQMLSSFAETVDAKSDGLLSGLIKRKQLRTGFMQTDILLEPYGLACEQLMLVGLGDASAGSKQKLNHKEINKLISSVMPILAKRGIKHVALSLPDFVSINGHADDEISIEAQTKLAQSWVEASYVSQYVYSQTKSEASDDNKQAVQKISLLVEKQSDLGAVERSVVVGQAIAHGMNLTKTLSDLPGNICTPSYLAKEAQALGKEYGFTTTILEEAKMKKLGMGALLSVSKGSREPAKFITMEYNGGEKNAPPIVLVGKGLTFDAGGISIKPAASMDEMKYDMCGGASVFGVMRALGELKLPVNVVGVVPSSENLPDGAANKPGDVVTSMKGLTIEVLNTDAEGRLILCDALTYVERFKPRVVIDIATLTGACMVALGQHASGLFSNDDELANALIAAGDVADDRVWRLPVWDEYQQQLKSNFADVANIGGRFAGAVTAACFLKRFTEAYKWAHLDIAGTAWRSGGNKGATGRPVGLLMQYILDNLSEQ